jgi:hypothetical protein
LQAATALSLTVEQSLHRSDRKLLTKLLILFDRYSQGIEQFEFFRPFIVNQRRFEKDLLEPQMQL